MVVVTANKGTKVEDIVADMDTEVGSPLHQLPLALTSPSIQLYHLSSPIQVRISFLSRVLESHA